MKQVECRSPQQISEDNLILAHTEVSRMRRELYNLRPLTYRERQRRLENLPRLDALVEKLDKAIMGELALDQQQVFLINYAAVRLTYH